MNNVGLYPWQQDLYVKMMTAYVSKTLGHALLLHGEYGCGADHLLSQLSAAMLCYHPDASKHRPCGKCQSCVLFAAGNHPDWYHLESQSGSPIGVESVRPLVHFCGQTSTLSGARVVTLYQADKLNIAASNALLKLLEEPGSGIVFLLSSERCQRILPTILSRVHHYHLPVPSAQSLRSTFAHIEGLDNSELNLHTIDKAKADQNYPEHLRQFRAAFESVMLGKSVATALSQSVDESLLADGFRYVLIWLIGAVKHAVGLTVESCSVTNLPKVAVKSLADFTQFYQQGLQLWQQLQYNNSINKSLVLDGFMIQLRAFYKEASL